MSHTMALGQMMVHLRSHGSRLIMTWAEDTDTWLVSWITSGQRFCAVSWDLAEALRDVYQGAVAHVEGTTRG